MSAPAKTPSTETRVYSIIFRIRWCPFTKMCRDHVARADSGTWGDLAVAIVLRAVCLSIVSPSVHFLPMLVRGSCSLFTLCARGVNHLSHIGHQVDPKLIAG